jgi:ADP-ribose pyrophosphatase YjhB (NUDIX family)
VALAQPASDSPRVRVAALMQLDGRVVLVRHRAGRSVYHLLPGGGVRYRETLEDALVREVAEETGLECHIGRPLLISDTRDPLGSRHVVNITFAADVTGGAITRSPADARVEAVDLVAAGELGSLDLRPPIADEIAAFVGDPGIPAIYLGSRFTPERRLDEPSGRV